MQINMITQPDDETCGPTSLHAVYQYYGDSISLEQVINEVEFVKTGGTIAPLLGKHALARGYDAKIYSYNLEIFDPSWFSKATTSAQLIDKLHAQAQAKPNRVRLQESSRAFIEFLSLGGIVTHHELSVNLLKSYFEQNIPLLTGLSATHLYQSQRETSGADKRAVYDDIKGEPCGHFVVLTGYDEMRRHVVVADPHRANPISHDNYYKVSSQRIIHAILLGVLTYDGNLLVITPRAK